MKGKSIIISLLFTLLLTGCASEKPTTTDIGGSAVLEPEKVEFFAMDTDNRRVWRQCE